MAASSSPRVPRAPGSWTSETPAQGPRCGPSPATTSTSPMSRSTTTEPSWPRPGPTVRPGSGTRPPGKNCTRSNLSTLTRHGDPRSARTVCTSPPPGPTITAVSSASSISSPGGSHEIDRVPAPIATSFDPGAARLAVASNQEPIAVVLDVESGDEVFTTAGHFGALRDVAWSPDGSTIATAANDGSARLFDAATGQQRAALLGHVSGVGSVDWSPESNRIITASADGTAKVWSLIEGAGREVFSLSAHDQRDEILGVAFSPDGTRVMTGDAGITATIIWNVGATSGAEVANLPALAYFPGAVGFSADGRHLLARVGAVRSGSGIRRRGPLCGHSGRWRPPRRHRPCPACPSAPRTTSRILAVDPSGRLVAVARGPGEWAEAGGGVGARDRAEGLHGRGSPSASGVEPRWTAPRRPRRVGVGTHRRPIG